jgi:curli production assembly/transport component CsgG/holdfast attachment protein HfaB
MTLRQALLLAGAACALAACQTTGPYPSEGVSPIFSFPVTSNETPYSQCLAGLATKVDANNKPVFSVGEVADKTGQINYDDNGHALTQGVSEMVISALYKTRMVRLVERLDLRIPLAEMKLAEQRKLARSIDEYKLPASDFIIVGALTELNYNITSGGAQLFIEGIGGGARTVVINVALDMRVINARNFSVAYSTSLQKQIYGYEVEANIFRFFGDRLVEFDAGQIQNEPLQLGVRSVVEMATYQVMTEFLGLPVSGGCNLVKTDTMANYLSK